MIDKNWPSTEEVMRDIFNEDPHRAEEMVRSYKEKFPSSRPSWLIEAEAKYSPKP